MVIIMTINVDHDNNHKNSYDNDHDYWIHLNLSSQFLHLPPALRILSPVGGSMIAIKDFSLSLSNL